MANQTDPLHRDAARHRAQLQTRCPCRCYVSPRLMGDERLRAFPDWLVWTGRLRERGALAHASAPSGTRQTTVTVATGRRCAPTLWDAMFNERDLRPLARVRRLLRPRDLLLSPSGIALSTIKVDLSALPASNWRCPTPAASRRRGAGSRHAAAAAPRAGRRASRSTGTTSAASGCATYYRDQFARRASVFVPSCTARPTDLGPDGLLRPLPPPEANRLLPPADDRAVRRRSVTSRRARPSPTTRPTSDTLDRLPPGAQLAQFLSGAAACARPRVRFRIARATFVAFAGTTARCHQPWRRSAECQVATRTPPSTVPALPPARDRVRVLRRDAAHTTSIFATAPGVLGQLIDRDRHVRAAERLARALRAGPGRRGRRAAQGDHAGRDLAAGPGACRPERGSSRSVRFDSATSAVAALRRPVACSPTDERSSS